jgi:hypothetical protein
MWGDPKGSPLLFCAYPFVITRERAYPFVITREGG